MAEVVNLTTMEVAALTNVDGGINLTDGHARLELSKEQAAVVARIPEMFVEASRRPFLEIERYAHATFLQALGQHSAPVGKGRVLSCYSSTLATDIVARALPVGASIAVLHPTFDNIADLLVTRGLRLVSFPETALLDKRWPEPPVSAIVVTHPNNPTGLITPEEHLKSLAQHAAHHQQTIIIDASFRGQVRDAQYDTYAVLEAANADWIVIEDTGKLWPTHELKVGLLSYSERTELPIARAFSESLLSASPVVLLLIAALARDWIDGGYERARAVVDRNRAAIRDALHSVDLSLADPASEISVARIELPPDGPDSSTLYADLVSRGVHVLPCAPFYWAEPAVGRRYARVSLARPAAAVDKAAKAFVESYKELSASAAA